MENLEKYIQNNIEEFNTGEMPAGHCERFMAKLEALQVQEQEKAPTVRPGNLFSRRSIFTASAAAAAIIIALFATLPQQDTQEQYTISIQELAQEMYLEETEVMQMIPEDEPYMINSVKSITEEAIPLTEQLPDELSPEKRVEILRKYYKAKTDALRRMKTLYAQSDEIID